MVLLPAWSLFAQSDSTIVGIVSDAATGEPVEHATVVLVGTLYAAVTGPDGQFELGPVSQPPFVVSVSATGFVGVQVTADLGQLVRVSLTRMQSEPLLRDPLMARPVRLPLSPVGLGSAIRMPSIASASGSVDAVPMVRGLWAQQVSVLDGDIPMSHAAGASVAIPVLPGDRMVVVSGPYAPAWGTGVLSTARLERTAQDGFAGSLDTRLQDIMAGIVSSVTANPRVVYLSDTETRIASVGTRVTLRRGRTTAEVDAGFTTADRQRTYGALNIRRDAFHRLWRSVGVTGSFQNWSGGMGRSSTVAVRAVASAAVDGRMEAEIGGDLVRVVTVASAAQTVPGLFVRAVLVQDDVTLEASARVDASSGLHPGAAFAVSIPVSGGWTAVGGAGTAARLIGVGSQFPRVWQTDLQIRSNELDTGLGVFVRKLVHSPWPANGTAWGGEFWTEHAVQRYVTINGAASVTRHRGLDAATSLPVSGAMGLTLSAPQDIIRAGAMVWVAAKHEVASGYVTADAWAEVSVAGGLRLRLSHYNATDSRNRLTINESSLELDAVLEPGRTWNLRLSRGF